MGRELVLVGDIGTDHDGFPPTPVIAGSPTVMVDGKPVARLGDPLAPHDKPKHPSHPRAIAEGSGTILVDGKPAALTGHAVDYGGVVIGGASAVGGDSGPGALAPSVATLTSSATQAVSAGEASELRSAKPAMSEAGKQWLKNGERCD